jgi:DNA-binding Xre family transcriptional regulator
VKWNLRLAAAQRGIWKASDLQRMLAEHGLVISAGKMSGLWSGQPASIKLDDLDIICVTIGCTVADLLVSEPEKVTKSVAGQGKTAAVAGGVVAAVVPQRRDGRSLPPA